jgi:hypothetical protein
VLLLEMPPNNGMHPTPHHEVFHVRCVWARVMPGVGLLQFNYRRRKMMRRLFPITMNFFMVLSLLPLLGCSSAPSSSVAEEFLRENINRESEGRIKLVSFSKINGQEAAPMGIPSYRLDYEAEIEFLDDCSWGTAGGDNRWRGDFTVFSVGEVTLSYPPFRKATKGSHTKVSGSVIFEKTEAGWRPVERNF